MRAPSGRRVPAGAETEAMVEKRRGERGGVSVRCPSGEKAKLKGSGRTIDRPLSHRGVAQDVRCLVWARRGELT